MERGEKALDEVIDVMGRATIEAVLRMSAEQLAGPKRPGERGEVAIPAYDAMQRDQRLADRMLAIMRNGVSTRRDETVLPAMAEQVGIGKSEVSRETLEAGTRVLQDWAERDFSQVDVLMIYLDGIQFGNHHVLAAVGGDADGKQYVLGVRSGASENATVMTALLEDLVARGIRPDRRRRFVVDGAKALRSAIAQVFGAGNEVQRCRNHWIATTTTLQRCRSSDNLCSPLPLTFYYRWDTLCPLSSAITPKPTYAATSTPTAWRTSGVCSNGRFTAPT